MAPATSGGPLWSPARRGALPGYETALPAGSCSFLSYLFTFATTTTRLPVLSPLAVTGPRCLPGVVVPHPILLLSPTPRLPVLFPVPSRDRAVGDSSSAPTPLLWPSRTDSDSDTEGGATGGEVKMEFLRDLFSHALGLGSQKERLLDELTIEGVTRYMQSERCRGVVCLVGAGISTSAGIPDFRTPSTGIYALLEKFHLPYPEAIFDISYFKKHPEPFFALAKEVYPGQIKPTVCHYFMRLLKEKGLLLRCYTQNVDMLERVAGLEPQDVVEAHGTFYTSHCISSSCGQEYDLSWMKEKVFSEGVPKCEKCQSLVKPDIVFFGETLPSRFFSCMQSDFAKVDLLIIMGTSLQVQPFAALISKAPLSTPRLLINKEKTGQTDPFLGRMMGLGSDMDFDSKKAYRDVAWIGDCDQGCLALADLLGWKKELEDLVRKEHARIDAQAGPQAPNPSTTTSPGKSPPPAKTREGEQHQ
ncbi:NAD-dependent protein deacetylase sirtuin-2 [Acomys russatus]|uniref:NAD-dependent protein deacetylase sirtuin-2 n=1 Tax=Acomys russatus TaxID=60746 RepID=UPI0021E1F14B|nr:NAD-dependent protein deacetylase sirtuin-2 [Acomys russatus]